MLKLKLTLAVIQYIINSIIIRNGRKKKNIMRLKYLYYILILLCAISIGLLLWLTISGNDNSSTEAAVQVRIVGSYSVDGQEPIELTEDTVIESQQLHTVTIEGHLAEDIPEGWVLMLRLDNIRATIRINGEEVYRFGDEASIPHFSKTTGMTWGYYVSPGIDELDDIQIVLQNIYEGRAANVFDDFINCIYLGHGYELYGLLQDKMPLIILGFAFIIIGIAVLLFSIIAKCYKMPGMDRGVGLSGVAIFGGLWILFDGGYPYLTLLFKNPLLFNTLDIMMVFIIPAVFLFYTYTFLESRTTKRAVGLLGCLSFLFLLAVIVIQILGIHDLYDMQNMAVTWSTVALIILILLMGYDGLVLKSKQVRLMLLSWLPLFISSFIDNINGFLIYIPERSIVKYGFSLSILLQFYQFILMIRANVRKHEENIELKYELLQNRLVVMLSQIQPHFLFNTLNDIRFLYRESPEKAEEALVSFTRYLRGNMESLNRSDLIPFDHELGHVQNYVDIEKMRFGDRLKVAYDIGAAQFFVPVLSIQPLVENAIRHGVAKKPEGGTVTLRTYEDVHGVVVEVSDDGAGLDPSKTDDGQTHTGIENVRMRVRAMCGGGVEIASRPGEGTTVRMHIPKEKEQ